MKRYLVTLPLEKVRYTTEVIWNIYELYIYGDIQYITASPSGRAV